MDPVDRFRVRKHGPLRPPSAARGEKIGAERAVEDKIRHNATFCLFYPPF
jgi:hypothetical protein